MDLRFKQPNTLLPGKLNVFLVAEMKDINILAAGTHDADRQVTAFCISYGTMSP